MPSFKLNQSNFLKSPTERLHYQDYAAITTTSLLVVLTDEHMYEKGCACSGRGAPVGVPVAVGGGGGGGAAAAYLQP
ncbi:hypothetical protein FOVG_10649 [Fusarium oxysporum f. sp. pisi HDV247]|uniref:Uncharacterized protein n=1 Tax=Fusarium oxysporum f. sp. pisi HDV247 TaxID=1080344 RepID=W9P176_FUSOX|nr:hypothetical protein FOVG_10649 [Fusarium oxysporum f. sp. pisi HDV247]